MKLKSSIILVLAALWGSGSWWWYTCKVKGFCSMQTEASQTVLAPTTSLESNNASNDRLDNAANLLATSNQERITNSTAIPDTSTTINTDKGSTNNNNTKSVKLDAPSTSTTTLPANAITAVVEDGSVDIYIPEAQINAMTQEEEKRVNRGTLSPAPIVPPPPETSPTVATTDNTNSAATSQRSTTPPETVALNTVKSDTSAKPTSAPSDNTTQTKTTTSKTTTSTNDSTAATSKTAVLGIKAPETKNETKSSDTKPAETKATVEKTEAPSKTSDTKEKVDTQPKKVEPQDPEGKDKHKMVVYQRGQSTPDRIGPARLNFPANSTSPTLSDETSQYFDVVATYLKKNKRATIKITGHTDSRGDADRNQEIGLKRAEIVKNALVRRGAPEKQIRVASMGESKPIASNNTPEGRQQNRRVEIMPLK